MPALAAGGNRQAGVSMNSKRSYLETLNAGRQRRAHSSIDELTQSLETLQQRIGRNADRLPDRPPNGDRDDVARRNPGRWDEPARRADPSYDMPPAAPARRAEPSFDSRPRAPLPRTPEGEPAYQSLAREYDRVRGQEDSIAAVGKIAGELKNLREDLRHQMTTGLAREFDALRKDIQRAYASPLTAKSGVELSTEFERLSGAIKALSEKTDDKSIKLLRLELEQVRGALDSLAREDTVRSVDRRWDDFDARFSKFEDRFDAGARGRTPDPAIEALTSRLEQINEAVNGLPESLSLRSLEEKVRTLAGAVDHFARQQDRNGNAPFDIIEERLDEISRAIVASTTTTTTQHFDPEPFERIEARITSLARQIEELVEVGPGGEVMDRLNLLSQRVDEIAASGRLPDQAIERLAGQVAAIADKLDRAPATPDTDHIFHGIEQRFDMLSSLLDRRQGDAMEHSQAVYRDLERRLEELDGRLDARDAAPAFDSAGIMNAIDARFEELAERLDSRPQPAGSGSAIADLDARFEELAQRLESRPQAPVNDGAIAHLEARLEDISKRLETSGKQAASVDPDIIRNLEAQVSELSRHLARPGAVLPEFEDIGPRLDDIERSLAGTRDSILEAARQAAESAVRSFAGSKPDSAAVAALADDLKSLDDLARRSDERNTKTFEAIHDTLLKIVDRLGSLEERRQAAFAELMLPAEPARKMALRDAPSIAPDEDMRMAEVPARPQPGEAREAAPVLRSPAEAAAEAAVAALDTDKAVEPVPRGRSLFGGLSRVFGGKKQRTEPTMTEEPSLPGMEAQAPTLDLEQPLDPKLANRPLEPGSGTPDLNAIMRRVRDERAQPAKSGETDAAKSDFIAAARRAAQAAAAEAEIMKRHPDITGPVRNMKLGSLFSSKRKPILMAGVAILVALAGLQLGKAFLTDDAKISSAQQEPAPIAEQAQAPMAEPAEAPITAPADTPVTDMVEAPAASEPAAADQMGADQTAAVRPVDQPDMEAAPQLTSPEDSVADTAEGMTATPEGDATTTASTPAPALAVSPPSDAAPAEASASAAPAAAPAPASAIEPVPADAGPLPLREAADAGDPKALFEVGSRYAEGRGMKSDMKTAAKWYEKAAELGFAPAQYRIGNFYEKGLGIDRDIAKAKTWYQMAAEQGNASAMHNLAVLFAMGADGTADNESAARWFLNAAELGVKDSQFNLGILAAKGVGMPQSLEESYKWFALVAKTGDRDAATKRDEIANALRPEQLERARAATELWKAKPVNAETNTVTIPDSWRESDGKTASIDMKQAVRNIQTILNKNGYDAGSADGVMGAKTKVAIASFQKANGMDATGEIDEKLVRKLLEKK